MPYRVIKTIMRGTRRKYYKSAFASENVPQWLQEHRSITGHDRITGKPLKKKEKKDDV